MYAASLTQRPRAQVQVQALSDHLPAEAAEALLELATGGKPRLPQPTVMAANPFDHPDAQRRFRVMTNVEELQRALDFPWEKWLGSQVPPATLPWPYLHRTPTGVSRSSRLPADHDTLQSSS